MTAPQAGAVLRHIRELVSAEEAGQFPDAELLGRFTRDRDEAAFAALVRRHAGLVLGVCRRVLGNAADAEDAFQAAFLVLAKKAHAIARGASLPCWLYQVAYRVALRAKGQAATRQKHERRVEGRAAADPLAEITGRELLAVLDEELQALAGRHREPLVLCYLEGHTCDEAARRLGCSTSTLKRRLEQARRSLARRLTKRGLTIPAALLTAGLAQGLGVAAVPARLAAETADAVLRLAAASPREAALAPAAVALAEGVLRATPTVKLWVASLLVLLGGVMALAASGLVDQRPARPDAVAAARPARTLLPTAGAGNRVPAPMPGNADKPKGSALTVTGRVLNAAGKPLAGVSVAVVGQTKEYGRGGDLLSESTHVLAQGQTDAEGRFRLAAAGASSGLFRGLYLLARTSGLGIELSPLNPGLPTAEVTVRLKPERVARGRLVDLQGQPAAGITVQVGWVGQSRKGQSQGVHFGSPPPGLAAWPEPVKTDAQGRFAVRGLSATALASLFIEGEARYAPQSLYFDDPAFAGGINRSLAPAQVIEGQVLTADTGQPIPHALMTVYSSDRELGSYGGRGGKADAEGRFRLSALSGKWLTVSAHAPGGEPYLAIEKRFQWEAGKVKHRLDLKLPRGVLIRGKVTEAGSGKPVARAAVQYYPQHANNPFYRNDVLSGWQAFEVSQADGTFALPVLPGPGHLLIMSQDGRYVHEEIGNNVLYNGSPGGTRYYADAIVKLPLPEDSHWKPVAVALKRGVTVKGKLVGPDGQAVGKALMICRLHVSALSPFWRFPVEVRDGQFELHGVEPDKGCPVAFLEPESGWGTQVHVSGKDAGKMLTFKLQPCGRAVARFVDPRGKPVAGHRPMIDIVVTPGGYRYDFEASRKGTLAADEEHLANVDRHNYWSRPVTDAAGRCTFPALIPGVTYRLTTYLKGSHAVGREFTAASGKTFDAGDITWGGSE